TWHLHSRGGVERSAEDAGERGLHRESPSARGQVQKYRGAGRGFIPADAGRPRSAVEVGSEIGRRDRDGSGEETGAYFGGRPALIRAFSRSSSACCTSLRAASRSRSCFASANLCIAFWSAQT